MSREPRTREPRGLFARPHFARRYHGNNLEARTRLGDGRPVDVARLPKVGPQDYSDRPSATIIPFPYEQAMARKVAAQESSLKTDVGSTVIERACLADFDDDASASSGTGAIEQVVVAAEPIEEDVISAVDAARPSFDEEGPITRLSDNNDGVMALANEDPDEAPSSSEVYGSTEIKSDDDEPIVAAREPERCHREWSRAQRRHFTAYACVGHSAMTIAKLMTKACGINVSIGTVRLAFADRTKKLKRAKRKEAARTGT